MPAYQASAVSQYLSSSAVLPGMGNFNAAGRAYPDVSAIGHNFFVVLNHSYVVMDGTSASAPVFAAVIALANQVLHVAGRSTVGFVNPLIYALGANNSAVFNDINCFGCVNNCGRESW